MSSHTVLGLVTDEAHNPVVLLAPVAHPSSGDVLLPIWLDEGEAASISIALSGRRFALPITHDLLQTVISRFAGEIERCELRIDERAVCEFTLVIRSWTEPVRLVCRPGDGIAMAVRAGAPVEVAADLVDRYGVVLESLGEFADIAAPTVSAFRRFLEEVEPEDFA